MKPRRELVTERSDPSGSSAIALPAIARSASEKIVLPNHFM
jgi:hypothetical protein